MSDTELRRLQRTISQNPDDYIAWSQYLHAGARVGAFDPTDWNASVTWITGESPPTSPFVYTADEFQNWMLAQEHANLLLHRIRNTQRQLSADNLAPLIKRTFNEIYSGLRPRAIVVARPDEYCQFSIVTVDNTYRILYDEQNLHVRNTNVLRRGRVIAEPRSVLDTTPQYLIEVDVHHPGSMYEQHDSEPVIIDMANNVPELITKLVGIIENEENQEVYYDPRDEEAMDLYDETGTHLDTHSEAYQQHTFSLLKECLDSLFQKYRNQSYSTIITDLQPLDSLSLNLATESVHVKIRQGKPNQFNRRSSFTVVSWKTSDPLPKVGTTILQQPHQVVEFVWRFWLDSRLNQLLGLLQ